MSNEGFDENLQHDGVTQRGVTKGIASGNIGVHLVHITQ